MKQHIPLKDQPFFDDRKLGFFNRIKQFFWTLGFPIFPYVRDLLTKLHLIRHHGHGDFHIGWLVPHKTAADLRRHLIGQGFDIDRIAWLEPGEVIGLRRRVSFKYQYHLRLFETGELYGHFELTPECNPFAHLAEKEFYDRREEFLEFLGDWVREEQPQLRD